MEKVDDFLFIEISKLKMKKKYELSLTEGVVPHIVTSHDSYSFTL